MSETSQAAPGAPHNYHQAELDKFAALANRWWDPDGPQKALHALNPVRLQYVRDRTHLDHVLRTLRWTQSVLRATRVVPNGA